MCISDDKIVVSVQSRIILPRACPVYTTIDKIPIQLLCLLMANVQGRLILKNRLVNGKVYEEKYIFRWQS